MSEKSKAYAWVAYMMTHEPKEMNLLLRYGTPSDRLIQLSNRRILISVDKNDKRRMTFPVTLNKSAGQKLLYKAAQDVAAFQKLLPLAAYHTYTDVVESIKLRRADATANVHLVAEAVLHRCATEFKSEVLFAFDSINAWIKSRYGKTLSYYTIRKALELLEEKFFITVREWGEKNRRQKATRIYVNFGSDIWKQADKLPASDAWVLSNAVAMNAVYEREATSRIDVLEANIHSYADKMASGAFEESRYAEGARLFPPASVRIAVADEEFIEAAEKELMHVDVSRYLGSLVQSVQEDFALTGQVGRGIPREARAG